MQDRIRDFTWPAERVSRGWISLGTSQPSGPQDHPNPATKRQMKDNDRHANGRGDALSTVRVELHRQQDCNHNLRHNHLNASLDEERLHANLERSGIEKSSQMTPESQVACPSFNKLLLCSSPAVQGASIAASLCSSNSTTRPVWLQRPHSQADVRTVLPEVLPEVLPDGGLMALEPMSNGCMQSFHSGKKSACKCHTVTNEGTPSGQYARRGDGGHRLSQKHE